MAVLDYKLHLHQLGIIGTHRKHGCLSPITLDDKTVRCGTCHICKKKRRQDWSFRLGQELKHSRSAYFITFTYDNKHLPLTKDGQETLVKKHTTDLVKRIRNQWRKEIIEFHKWKKPHYMTNTRFQKLISYKIKKRKYAKIRYYLCGEYGTKYGRPHYHMILFNATLSTVDNLNRIWNKGTCFAGTVTPHSINYTTKYIAKHHISEKRLKNYSKKKKFKMPLKQREYTHMSTKPPLGHQYLRNAKYHRDQRTLAVRNINGNFQSMPRYYRDRIWTDEIERQIIITENIIEYEIAKEKEIQRLAELGQLNATLEQSKMRDIDRNAKKQLQTINTF